MVSNSLYALLIGIDCYLPNKLPDGKSYRTLSGAVRDVLLVEKFLRNNLRVPEERIFKLTASNNGTDQPSEPPDKWPTYENMLAAFQRLRDVAQPGEQVYIHYSGHGGRSRTKFPDLKTNGLDESLVPTDIGKSQARYLRDIELAHILKGMVDKGLIVTLVLDCCHSGGATRGLADAEVRGIDTIDTTERPGESLVATDEELKATWQSLTQNAQRDLTLGSGLLPEPKGYVLLAACRPHESAIEYLADGTQRNGALTYWLIDSLKTMGAGATYKLIYDRIVPKIHSQLKLQTPMLQGEGERAVFGRDRFRAVYAVNVMDVEWEKGQVLLNAGTAQGLRQGTKFAIYLPGVTDFTQVNQRLAVVEVTESIGATCAWAKIKEQENIRSTPIEEGAQAVLLEPGTMRLRSVVGLVNQDRKWERFKEALEEEGKGFVVLAADGKPVDYQIAVNPQGEYEIWDRSGALIPNLRPALKIDEDSAAARLVKRLVHLTKYHNVQRLDNADTTSPLHGKLEVELLKAQPDYQRGDRAEPRPFDNPGNTPTIQVGEWMFVRVKNASSVVLNITLLYLGYQWVIKQLYPNTKDALFWPFDPGEEHFLPLRPSLADGYDEGREILKVFATVGATQFRWLELPALDKPSKQEDISGRQASNSLEEFLLAMTASELGIERREFDIDAASLEWVTEQREITIRR